MTETPDERFIEEDDSPEDHLEQASDFLERGKYLQAIQLYERALTFLERRYGEDQPQLIDCLEQLSQAYEGASMLSDALRIQTRLLRHAEEAEGEGNLKVAALRMKLAEINQGMGRLADALNYCNQSMASARECLPEEAPLSQLLIKYHRNLTDLIAGKIAPEPPEAWHLADPNSEARRPDDGGKSTEAVGGESSDEVGLKSDEKPVFKANLKADHLSTARQSQGSKDSDSGIIPAAETPAAKSLNPNPRAIDLEQPDEIQSTTKTGEIYSQIRAIRARSIEETLSQGPPIRKPVKTWALPGLAVVALVIVVLFFVMHKQPDFPPIQVPTAKVSGESEPSHGIAKKGAPTPLTSGDYYRTGDGSKEMILSANSLARFATASSVMELPYVQIACDWGGLASSMADSVLEKQIWAEKNESSIKSQDNIVYYSADGPESLIIAKMRRLAGNAQGCLLRTGEYPRLVSNDMVSQFAFVNPLDNIDAPIKIIQLTDSAQEVKSSLAAGRLVGDESAGTPCKITCYAVLTSSTDAQGVQLRATDFFVRGWDRGGHLIEGAQPGQSYIVTASDTYLLAVEEPVKPGPIANKVHNKEGGKKQIITPPRHAVDNIVQSNLPVEKPNKATKLWIVSSPPCPVFYLHYLLLLLLVALSLAAFLRSGLAAVDMKGRTISSGSNIALILAKALLGLAVLVALAQLVIFV